MNCRHVSISAIYHFFVSGDVCSTRVYNVLSFFALCAVQLHTKRTTRRRTPVCHNSSQATALNLG